MTYLRQAYTFDDISLVPKYSNIRSRQDVDITSYISKRKGLKISSPIISSPMHTITEDVMANKMATLGGAGVIHRFHNHEDRDNCIKIQKNQIAKVDGIVGFAIGVGDDWRKRAEACIEAGGDFCVVDIAHGNSKHHIDLIVEFRKSFGDFPLVGANIADADGCKRLCDVGVDAIRVGVGAGCLASDTRILMATGVYKNITDIKPGEEVINKFGNPVKVNKVFSTGYKKIHRVKNSNFYKDTLITSNHECWVGNYKNEKIVSQVGYKGAMSRPYADVKWQSIKDFENSTFLFPNNINFNLEDQKEWDISYYFQRDNREVYNKKIASGYELGYLFGTFLGDGSSFIHTSSNVNDNRYNPPRKRNSTIGSVTWFFGANETKIANKLNSCLSKVTGKKGVTKLDKNVLKITLYSKPWAHIFQEFGKFNEKRLPEQYYCLDNNYLKGLWEGLLDSDGFMDGKRETIHNTSPYILELLTFIKSALGETIPYICRRGKCSSKLVEAKSDAFSATMLQHPDRRLTVHDNHQYQIIKNLDISEEGLVEIEVWDLEVNDETHSFIAENMIVHNSLCTTRVTTGFGVPSITSLIDCAEVIEAGNFDVILIQDGGIRQPADAVKSFAAGADLIMVGGIFAGAIETPGDPIFNSYTGSYTKTYAGSASSLNKRDNRFIEGSHKSVTMKGSIESIVQHFNDGIRSGLSYGNAKTIEDFKQNVNMVIVTNNGVNEAHPHHLLSSY